MTNVTLTDLQAYLAKGAPLMDVVSMIEMLKIYKNDIEEAIDTCAELLPQPAAYLTDKDWGTPERRKRFKAIAGFLLQQGFKVSIAQYAGDGDHEGDNIWIISKGDRKGWLHWSRCRDQFFIEGIERPRESGSAGHLLQLPIALSSWFESDAY